jgi:hypothetical protein
MQLPKRFSLTSQRCSKDGTVFRMKKGGMATIKRRQDLGALTTLRMEHLRGAYTCA